MLLLTAITLACLVPFIDKAFYIDDPFYIWCAHHILSHPFDFSGSSVNWNGHESPVSVAIGSPPLVDYYIALVGALFGWSEVALHTGFLLPAVALVTGTYFLARKCCSHPLCAALMTVTAPGFLVSSTSIMCDTTMMAFWVWSVYYWIEGIEIRSAPKLGLAALLIAACILAKYFGLSLIPLLFAYSLWKERRIGRWIVFLCLPAIVFVCYEWLTSRLYGHALFGNAVYYALDLRVPGGYLSRLLTGLAFSGGCMIILLPAAPLLLNRMGLAAGTVAMLLIGLLLAAMEQVGVFSIYEDNGSVKWLVVVQFSLFVVIGGGLILLATVDLLERKTPVSVLLFLWIIGTLIFACTVNWTVSGRNILPIIPAASLLLMRRLEGHQPLQGWDAIRVCGLPLGVSIVVALVVARADYLAANSARTAASSLVQQLGTNSSAIGFEGHWGFQYYMERLGAKALDRQNLRLASNEAIIVPLGNSYLFPLPRDRVVFLFVYKAQGSKWVATMNAPFGAGYYSDGWGPLPYVFCSVPAEQYLVFRVK